MTLPLGVLKQRVCTFVPQLQVSSAPKKTRTAMQALCVRVRACARTLANVCVSHHVFVRVCCLCRAEGGA